MYKERKRKAKERKAIDRVRENCPHCDHSSVCQHQESSKSFHNGDQWIYQCQTCECLNREIDCWDLECPPVTCENPIQKPGDCCLRCDTDPCSLPYNTTHSQLKGCAYNGLVYKPGEKVPLIQDPCSSCHCQDGYLCCKYNSTCNASDDFIVSELFLRINDTANNINTSSDYIHKNSEVDQNKITNHSKDSSYISSKTSKLGRRLLSALFSTNKDSSYTDHERKRIKRNRNSINNITPIFGNMKLTPLLKGAFVKGASVPGSSFDTDEEKVDHSLREFGDV